MDMSEINLLLEQHGPEAVEASPELLELVKDVDVIITQFCPITTRRSWTLPPSSWRWVPCAPALRTSPSTT